MLNSIWKNKIFVMIALIVALFIPQTLLKPAQTEYRGIAIGVGIDKINGEVAEEGDVLELSTQIIVPHYATGFSENAHVISSQGRNISDAFAKLSLHLGKTIGYSHCSVIIIGEGVDGDMVEDSLDWFYRSKRLDNNALVVYTQGSAKDVLTTSIQAENYLSLGLNNIMQLNEEFEFAHSKQIINILENSYKGYGANLIGVLDVVDKDYLGLSIAGKSGSSGVTGGDSSNDESSSSGSSGSTSSGSSGGGSEKNKYISNNGDTAVIQKGKIIKVLNNEEVRGFNVLLNSAKRGVVVLKNVKDEYFNNATITLSERHQDTFWSLSFSKNGKPRIYYDIYFDVRLEQILENAENLNYLAGTNDYITLGVQRAMKTYVQEKVADAVAMSKEYNFDCLEIYDKFNRFKYKEWQDYLKTLSNKDEYIKDVEFFVNVHTRGLN